MHRYDYDPSQTGSSLFEVLVAVLILAVGILGVAAVQTGALRNATYSLEFSQAAYQGQAMLERMRNHRQQALAGQYHTGGLRCDAQTGSDPGRWLQDVQDALGETACAEITCQAGALWCKVSIHWGAEPTQTGESHRHVLTTGTRL